MRYFLLSSAPGHLPYNEMRQINSKTWVISMSDMDCVMHHGMFTGRPDIVEIESMERASVITKLAFRNRFTDTEKAKLYVAAKTSPSVQAYIDDVAAANFIDLARVDTINAVRSLEAAKIIGVGRADEILYETPKAHELK